ncbi:HAMP domain-containing methyl-accepting chemotaxis protein [Pararhizobium sp.]|uniref:HAMP domain-containing methyl-accepting chemotaxis protein n=1 Tax=Pararhizobium sp. TaxID=1977563 RepID=UPI002725019B|nr:HAMP domain-containing methyl-accepting chemotaxis protein [Pararhizobium sp.]MDO9415952.1 HAMP domain-containing methyl-accepting chemotaxis protein [Pararhizobium sp.]
MSRLKISHALAALFIAVGLMVGAMSYVGKFGIEAMAAKTDEITQNWLPSVSNARALDAALSDVRLGYARHLLSLTPFEKKSADKIIAEASGIFETLLKTQGELAQQGPEADLVANIGAAYAGYIQSGEGMLKASNNLETMKAGSIFKVDMRDSADKVEVLIADLLKINLDGASAAVEDSARTKASITLLNIIMMVVSAVVVLAAIVYAMRGIARPIKQITTSMTKLAEGDADTAIPHAGRRDEIGEMAGAVEIFRQAALENRRLEEDAKEQRAINRAENSRIAQEAEAAAQLRLQQATSGLATGLKRLAAGDLSFQLHEPFAPDFEALRHDLNTAVSQLADTMRAVAHTAGQIDTGTREISQSSDDLSKRTEQQAASLEETAAALDQITVNVSNSSRRTEEARSVAGQANTSAAQSGAVVANAVNAMRRIEESSSQISNIIGVIDEIAFQTNLLALNAGVEAARAGDAGKGFAVVAQEVRELAQRSAKAAKEIKELIRNSTTEVEGGVKLVRDTGEALKTIESYIITINQHMDAIATSAREQSVGLQEVNTAVNQMDQVTQQNAAMVEETNAASFGLATESGKLRELIAQFQLASSDISRQSQGGRRAA